MNNPFHNAMNSMAKYFRFGRMGDSNIREIEANANNSRGFSQEQLDLNYGMLNYGYDENGNNQGHSAISIQFDQYFKSKAQRIYKYREMSLYSDIANGLDMICDEAITEDDKGIIVTLDIKEEIPEHIEEQLRDYWDYVVNDVFSFNDTGWELFRRWLVDSELYIELILDDEGRQIIGFKVLPPDTMTPIFDEWSDIIGYSQLPSASAGTYGDASGTAGMGYGVQNNRDDSTAQTVTFDKDQVIYVNFGETMRNKLDVIGFLESNVKVYNQLRYLEDAVVVYRIVRAPERRIWNIPIGKLPKGKAEEYIKSVMQRYKKNVHYDPNTGAMDSSKNFMAMTEDYWFSKDEAGNGTTIDTLAGGQGTGDLTELYYFQRKLHKNMKVPSNRWGSETGEDGGTPYSTGKEGDITREEIQFSMYVSRLRKRFSPLLLETFMTQLRLSNIIDDKYLDESLYRVKFTHTNLWKQYKELAMLETRFGILGAIETYIYKPEENEQAPFSMEFVLRNWFMMSDEEYDKNKKLLDRDKEAARIMRQSIGFNTNTNDENSDGVDEPFGGNDDDGDMGDFGGGFGADTGEDTGMGDDVTGGDGFGVAGGETGEFDTEQ